MVSIFTAFPAINGLSQQQESLVAGASLELECTVSGVPVPVVTWFKDGQQLMNITDIVTIVQNDGVSTLRIRASTEGSDRYMCIATNAAGSVNSSVLQVDVTSGKYVSQWNLSIRDRFLSPLERLLSKVINGKYPLFRGSPRARARARVRPRASRARARVLDLFRESTLILRSVTCGAASSSLLAQE